MKRFKFRYLIIGLAAATMFYACSKNFLTVAPVGTLNPDILANEKGVQGLLVGAYSILDGQGGNNGGWGSAISNWVYGSVCADEAYKGSTSDDQGDIVPLETWSANSANSYPSQKWDVNYDGIQRANQVLRVAKLAKDIPATDLAGIEGEARFLRAFYHFELKKVFNNIPYVDESVADTSGQASVSNVDGSGQYLNIWPQIEADFSFAVANLPETQPQVGRANKWAAQAFLAEVYLFQAKYDEAKPLLEDLIANGKTSDGLPYDLINYASNFNPSQNHKNDAEAVFSVQMSVNDGSGDAQNVGQGISNGNYGDALNFPYGAGPGACCGFFNPSQDLANAYKTDGTTGLPVDNYNAGNKVSDPSTPYTGTLDPRIDWAIGRKGIPYLDWGPHPGDSWIRDPPTNGHFNPKKNVYASSQKNTLSSTEAFWAAVELVANNVNVIRFADVLLMAAEAETQSSSPDLSKALTYVNRVRTRAADPNGWVYAGAATYSASTATYSDHTVPAANYKIGLYSSFADNTAAMKAIMTERRLEMSMEGHRFFDLVRWGIAGTVLNAYAAYTKGFISLYDDATFTPGKNEYFAIPIDQIDILRSSGTEYLKQNPGY